MASEQAEITRNMPMKIALNVPKSLFWGLHKSCLHQCNTA